MIKLPHPFDDDLITLPVDPRNYSNILFSLTNHASPCTQKAYRPSRHFTLVKIFLLEKCHRGAALHAPQIFLLN